MSNLDSDMWDRDYPTEEEVEQQLQGTETVDNYYEEEEIEEWEDDSEELDFLDSLEDEDYEEEVDLMQNARIRLEQGRLYEMLIQHDLFGDIDANPTAVSMVQKEIKDFIMERLEILLGIRAEKEVEVHKVEAQFNDVEVEALKQVAAKLTKGASVHVPQPTVAKPSLGVKPKNSGLKKLSSKPKEKVVSPLTKKKKITKPLPKKGKGVKEKKVTPPPMPKAQGKAKTIEDIARRDIEYTEMMEGLSPEERAEVVAKKHNRPKSNKKIDPERANSVYSQRSQTNVEGQMFSELLRRAGKL